MASRRLRVVYALDAVGDQYAGGLRAGLRQVELLREEHDVVLLGTGEGVPGLFALPEVQIPFASGLLTKYQFKFARPDDRVIARALAGADLLHVQLPFWLGYRSLALARQLGVPVVVSHHVQPENLLLNLGLHWKWLARALNRLLVSSFYNRADVVVCPTEFSRQELERFGLTAPSVVISNGMPSRFRPAPRLVHGEPFTILTVGRLAREKRHELLFDAVRLSKHREKLRLIVAGKGPLEPRLQRRAVELAGRARVGFVPDDELLSLYQRADLYVHPSDVELEGLTVLEAARCGCPTLIADAPESAAVELALGRDWLFEAGNPRALAERIDHFFEHPELLARARERTLERTAGHGIERSVRRLDGVYRWLTARAHGARHQAPMLPGRLSMR